MALILSPLPKRSPTKIWAKDNSFTEADVADLASQPFVEDAAPLFQTSLG
jgi:hypothetical protein